MRKNTGWFGESRNHSLASKGIKSKQKISPVQQTRKILVETQKDTFQVLKDLPDIEIDIMGKKAFLKEHKNKIVGSYGKYKGTVTKKKDKDLRIEITDTTKGIFDWLKI